MLLCLYYKNGAYAVLYVGEWIKRRPILQINIVGLIVWISEVTAEFFQIIDKALPVPQVGRMIGILIDL